ncbi:DsrE family protein [Pseudodesulfovibrio indicus]|uniref:DsrE family protein n=1 Tax=Pseudodesulfovibrio indicus TaxID=1716143 RepID=UPI00292F1B5F|nr:DsrE family protein [Pseudodesulfovibrio indicus]
MDRDDMDKSLCIIWSSPDPEVADNLVLMYAHNALKKLWWDRVRLIIWGPSARLAAEDERIRARLSEMMADGVEVWACRACADNYGVAPILETAGFNVLYVGEPFTEMLQSGWTQLTF